MRREKNDPVHTWLPTMPADRPLARTLILVLALSCGACAKAPALTPLTARDVAESGTAAFDAPRLTVLNACALALRKQGYAIDIADPDTGLVVTLRSPSSLRSPSGARLFRAYVLKVTARRSGRVEVVAWPAVSEADVHRGTRRFTVPAWELAEEHAAWTRFFEDVRCIVERASP
jgi:hypothetical protein